MGTDLEALDELFSEPAAEKARTRVKFQPKTKPRTRKGSFAVDVGEDKTLSPLEGPSSVGSETLKDEKSLRNNGDFVSGVAALNPSLENFVAGESLGSGVGLPSDILPEANGLNFTMGNAAGESAEIFVGLESLDEFYSQSTTSTAGAANRSPKDVDVRFHRGNDLSTSCPVNNDAEGVLVHSEIPTIHVSDTRSLEEEPVIPVVSHLNESDVGVSSFSPSPVFTTAQDPLTCGDSVSYKSGAPQINTRCVEIEDTEANPCLETLFRSTTESSQRRGKYKPKPKAQIDREKPGGISSCPLGSESVGCSLNAQYVPSESEYINEASVPTMPANDLQNFSSLRFDNTSSQIPESEELCPKIKKRNRRKVPDRSLDYQQAYVSGLENEADDDENYVCESTSGSHINEDESIDGNLQERKTARKRKVPRKSNRSAPQKQKPVRKRKKANEAPDPASNEAPEPASNEAPDPASKGPRGKFSHTTRRKRRQVDKALLDTPEDEIDVTKLCMRDLILLAEHRERISSKGVKTSEAPSTMQSAGTSYAGYNDDETFASEQGGLSDDQTIPIVQESSTYTNYQTYMNKTPRSRWSKQDTELFYEALRQFGSDISMIQQLFPGRSRTQVKLKYKKEERQNPLRLLEALTTRSKDHSHFQLVIEHLKEIADQEKENSCRDDSTGFPGDEEEVNPEINEEVAKPEQSEEREVEVKEPDVAEDQSPAKSSDTEDDLSRWSQYKSEL